jgi:hypothetical protein
MRETRQEQPNDLSHTAPLTLVKHSQLRGQQWYKIVKPLLKLVPVPRSCTSRRVCLARTFLLQRMRVPPMAPAKVAVIVKTTHIHFTVFLFITVSGNIQITPALRNKSMRHWSHNTHSHALGKYEADTPNILNWRPFICSHLSMLIWCIMKRSAWYFILVAIFVSDLVL